MENNTQYKKESKMQYWLKLGIKISVVTELLIVIGFTIAFVNQYASIGTAIFNYAFWGIIIATQVYLYRKIDSYWDEMSFIKKSFMTIIIGIPAIYFGSGLIYFVIVLVAILIAIWAYSAGQPVYNRIQREGKREAEMIEVNEQLRGINEQLKKL